MEEPIALKKAAHLKKFVLWYFSNLHVLQFNVLIGATRLLVE